MGLPKGMSGLLGCTFFRFYFVYKYLIVFCASKFVFGTLLCVSACFLDAFLTLCIFWFAEPLVYCCCDNSTKRKSSLWGHAVQLASSLLFLFCCFSSFCSSFYFLFFNKENDVEIKGCCVDCRVCHTWQLRCYVVVCACNQALQQPSSCWPGSSSLCSK